MLKKHHDVKIKGKLVDMSDMDSDALVMCQKRYTSKESHNAILWTYITFIEQVLFTFDAIVLDTNPYAADEKYIGWITG